MNHRTCNFFSPCEKEKEKKSGCAPRSHRRRATPNRSVPNLLPSPRPNLVHLRNIMDHRYVNPTRPIATNGGRLSIRGSLATIGWNRNKGRSNPNPHALTILHMHYVLSPLWRIQTRKIIRKKRKRGFLTPRSDQPHRFRSGRTSADEKGDLIAPVSTGSWRETSPPSIGLSRSHRRPSDRGYCPNDDFGVTMKGVA